MKTMLDARIVAASTHRACAGVHGAVHGDARMNAASAAGEESAVIGSRDQSARIEAGRRHQDA